jgi:hypothetical protein
LGIPASIGELKTHGESDGEKVDLLELLLEILAPSAAILHIQPSEFILIDSQYHKIINYKYVNIDKKYIIKL